MAAKSTKKRASPSAGRSLVIDIGGTGIKMLVLGADGQPVNERARELTPRPAAPQAVMEVIGSMVSAQPGHERVSVGFPGVVVRGVVRTAPNLGTQRWAGFELEAAVAELTKKPTRAMNDADLQGYGVIDGEGTELVLTLGTGLGSAVFTDGRLVPNLELAHQRFRKGDTYEERVSNAALKRVGKKRWRKRVARVFDELARIWNQDRLHVGGGNARYLQELPDGARTFRNEEGMTGGAWLWSESLDVKGHRKDACAGPEPAAPGEAETNGRGMTRPLHHPDTSAEHRRLVDSEARRADWKRWGPYVADRAWGTVREDYSLDGDAWSYFPHEHARSRAYRWNEDGLAGACDRRQTVCLALALWNGRDPMLKERLFGVSGHEGNHAEDVKEHYFHLDNVPSHAWMRMLYKYPQVEYPYERLVAENRRRGAHEPEHELLDELSEAFAAGRYFDVFVEYAKAAQEDLLCRITAVNRGPEAARLHLLPHVWFRNTWSWGYDDHVPRLRAVGEAAVQASHRDLGERWWWARAGRGAAPELLFTDNVTNRERVHGVPNVHPHVKDAFHDAVVHGRREAVRPERHGTKAAAHFEAEVPPGEEWVVETRFADARHAEPFADVAEVFELRRREAEAYHEAIAAPGLGAEQRHIQRQAHAGLLWTKQFYHFDTQRWIEGDPAFPPPPVARLTGRNSSWRHHHAFDVLSMPDKWEYPWYAAWDLAFHVVPLARLDPEWAKRQVVLLLREWYMHPSGQVPAYEWALGDVNPPVQAWAALRVYEVAREITGKADTVFLERVFHKLLLNFTWWVNRKDKDGNDVFSGGFLGLDNIGVFDRSQPLPTGGHVEQADSTAWMAKYCLDMMSIALELARTRPAYEDVATKFLEHFLAIACAMRDMGDEHLSLWDEADGFFYDVIHLPDGSHVPMKIRSVVGLIPLFAAHVVSADTLAHVPRFHRRARWLAEHRPHLVEHVASLTREGEAGCYLLSVVTPDMLERVLARLLDPAQFLSEHGLRSLSREHAEQPYVLHVDGRPHEVRYEPGESSERMFGGNSNWRGPIWFPLNYLAIEALETYHRYHGAEVTVELPTGSGRRVTLDTVARDLACRLVRLFEPDPARGGRRPALSHHPLFWQDPHWRDHLAFHEYFHGDDGSGCGASHQTGWTALVAELVQRYGVE